MIRAVVTLLTVVGFGALFNPPALATLIGTQVSGGMFFGGSSTNCFEPEFGCDAAPGSGVVATIGTNVPTFVWPGVNFYTTVDFSDDTLRLDFNPDRIGAITAPFQFTFQDSAFAGLQLVSFGGFASSSEFSYSLSGDTITIDVPPVSTNFSPYSLTFQVASVPEPSTALLLIVSLGILTVSSMRRRAANAGRKY